MLIYKISQGFTNYHDQGNAFQTQN